MTTSNIRVDDTLIQQLKEHREWLDELFKKDERLKKLGIQKISETTLSRALAKYLQTGVLKDHLQEVKVHNGHRKSKRRLELIFEL